MNYRDVGNEILKTLRKYGVVVSIRHVIVGPMAYRYYFGSPTKTITIPAGQRVEAAKSLLMRRGAPISKEAIELVLNAKDKKGVPVVARQRQVNVSVTDITRYEKDLQATLRNPDIMTGIDKQGFFIEVPSPARTFFSPVDVRSLWSKFSNGTDGTGPLCVPIGVGIDGTPVMLDIAGAPHVLISGTTGSGKSVAVHTIIESMVHIYSPREVVIVPMDYKGGVELEQWAGLPHFTLDHVVYDTDEGARVLADLTKTVGERMRMLAEEKTQSVLAWNANHRDNPLPYVVIVIDEIAALTDAVPRVRKSLVSLGQRARAAGVHMIVTTQRPDVNAISGSIKANFPATISMRTRDTINSRISSGKGGAEHLLGSGDAFLFTPDTAYPVRFQVTTTTQADISKALADNRDLPRATQLKELV